MQRRQFLESAAAAVLAAAPAAISAESLAAPELSRSISVDFDVVKGPRSKTFKACVGAGRVGEGLRADWQRQLRMCKDDIGFEYLRCHGLLHDELGVYREDKAGKPIYNFQYIDLVYDFLLSICIRPFVEIGFMPNLLATIPTESAGPDGMADDPDHPGKKRRVTVFQWKSNVTPPKSWDKWQDLITALIRHWTVRYGGDEVRKWHFEIWNEPDHPAFFSPNDPARRKEEYFELYTRTVKAITGIDSAYRVGGPATAGPGWVDDFIHYAAKNAVPLDFISFHSYGVGSGATAFDEFGDKVMYLSANLDAPARGALSRNAVIAHSPRPDLPVHITEWSASYSARDPVHDSYFEAAYICEQLKLTENLASMSYWTFTDIFEETGIPPRPFHGGFGLVNIHGIKKPAYFAYKFLNRLGGTELVNADPRSWVCRGDTGSIQAVVWNIVHPTGGTISNQDHFRKVVPPDPTAAIKISVKSLKPGRYRLTLTRIGFDANDAYTAYLRLGSPMEIDRVEIEQLKAIASGKPESIREVTVESTGIWEMNLPMRTDDVLLVELTPL